MRIDLSCPAEILRAELPTAEEPWIRILILNGTDRGINSCEATAKVLDREGRELGRTVHRARALAGRPYGTFLMTIPMEPIEGAAGIEARLDKAWFEDNDVWRRNEAAEIEYEDNMLPPGNDLNALKYVAGPTAVGFPSQQARLWVCVCGRANGNGSDHCARCRREKETLFRQYNREAVLRQVSQRERQLDLKSRGAREEAAQIQRQREEEFNRQQARKKQRYRLWGALGATLLIAAATYWGGAPLARRISADQAAKDGRLEDAEMLLTGITGFPGVEERITAVKLEEARRDGTAAVSETAEFPETTVLADIAERLRAEDATSEDGRLADRVDMIRAKKLLAEGKTGEAETLVLGLPEETEGRTETLAECAYARGEAAMAAGEYDKAEKIFLGLGAWKDAENRVKDCQYDPALKMIEAGDYESAIAKLSMIPEYLDSEELIRKSRYLQGITLEAAGETEAARQAYLQAGTYEDAEEKAAALRWRQAETEYANGNWAVAMEIFREMDGIGDAREKWILSATELARAAYKIRDYERAAEILTGLPEDTRETLQIRTRAYFLGAKAAADRGETEKAVEMMEKVPDYGDARKNIRNWRIALAEAALTAGDAERAKEWLEPVAEENYSAQRLMKQIDRELAKKAEEADTTGADTEKDSRKETEAP